MKWSPGRASAHDPIALLEAAWPEIVGENIAQHSRPERIAGGTLTVATRSSAWSHQLSFLAEQVLEAVHARCGGIEQLRFRVAKLAERRAPTGPRSRPGARQPRPATLGESASPTEALERFRRNVEGSARARRAAGWGACAGCGALIEPGQAIRCRSCLVAASEAQAAATARLLAEAPWLGYAGTAALVEGLQLEEYERIRGLLLAHWWDILARARSARRLSRDGRERQVAGSYVLLRSNIAPEEIAPATVRSILGDELHELLYGEARKGDAARDKKRRT
jgi:hypothetical protein